VSLLELEAVTVRFGGVAALEEVSFAVAKGELLGLIGPNGAGKTTMLRAITGVVSPERGRVRLAGRDLAGLPPHRRIRLGLALSQQLVRPFRSLATLDNVALAAGRASTRSPWLALCRLDRRSERARARDLLGLVGIADAAGSAPASLPLGHLKRLELARALALDPQLLLLDEPLGGLNHIEAAQLADTVADLNRQGRTVILIEHNLGEVMRICRRLVVLDNGRKIAEGAPDTVMADAAVRAAYLGEEAAGAAA
jgi:branched-chain amino acid transport system ATP-binding protein